MVARVGPADGGGLVVLLYVAAVWRCRWRLAAGAVVGHFWPWEEEEAAAEVGGAMQPRRHHRFPDDGTQAELENAWMLLILRARTWMQCIILIGLAGICW